MWLIVLIYLIFVFGAYKSFYLDKSVHKNNIGKWKWWGVCTTLKDDWFEMLLQVLCVVIGFPGVFIAKIVARKIVKQMIEEEKQRAKNENSVNTNVDEMYNSSFLKDIKSSVSSSVQKYIMDCLRDKKPVNFPHLIIESYRIRICYLDINREESLSYRALGYDMCLSEDEIVCVARAFGQSQMFNNYSWSSSNVVDRYLMVFANSKYWDQIRDGIEVSYFR